MKLAALNKIIYNLLLLKNKIFSTYLILRVFINYHQEVKIDLLSIMQYQRLNILLTIPIMKIYTLFLLKKLYKNQFLL